MARQESLELVEFTFQFGMQPERSGDQPVSEKVDHPLEVADRRCEVIANLVSHHPLTDGVMGKQETAVHKKRTADRFSIETGNVVDFDRRRKFLDRSGHPRCVMTLAVALELGYLGWRQ